MRRITCRIRAVTVVRSAAGEPARRARPPSPKAIVSCSTSASRRRDAPPPRSPMAPVFVQLLLGYLQATPVSVVCRTIEHRSGVTAGRAPARSRAAISRPGAANQQREIPQPLGVREPHLAALRTAAPRVRRRDGTRSACSVSIAATSAVAAASASIRAVSWVAC